jgi:hypothetical protein
LTISNLEGEIMSNSQMVGIRIGCLALGWAIGSALFGTDAVWLWNIKSFIWCGFAGGCIGILLTTQK